MAIRQAALSDTPGPRSVALLAFPFAFFVLPATRPARAARDQPAAAIDPPRAKSPGPLSR